MSLSKKEQEELLSVKELLEMKQLLQNKARLLIDNERYQKMYGLTPDDPTLIPTLLIHRYNR